MSNRKRFWGEALGLLMGIVTCAAQVTQDVPEIEGRKDMYGASQSVGLVLSGGGAKGIAHIGVIQALEDNDIPIDYIAGTSMGAIVGGLYAAGYTPAEMMQLIKSPGFANWSSGRIDPNLSYYFLERPQTPAFAHININLSRSDTVQQSLMPSSLISPLPMNFAFMDLFAAYTAECGGDFNKLFVPFRCVTSDVEHKHKIVCRKGMLSDAIRASMSFPAVFAPIKMDGVEVYDGGIYDNFPVDVMREDFAPDIMIGVDVHSLNVPPSNSIVAQLENMIIQNNSYYLPPSEGIHIHVDVSKFGLLDWGKATEIYEKGYERGLEMIDSIKSRVHARISTEVRTVRRNVFKSGTPYVRFDSVHVTGGTPAQNHYLKQLFLNSEKHGSDTFGIAAARLAYYRALSPGKLRNLFPQAHYNPEKDLFTLDLTADVKNNFSLGAGGFLSSSINSMIYVSGNYSSMSFLQWETNIRGWIGQSYMAGQFDAQLFMTRSLPSALHLEAVVARQRYYQTDKLFYQDNSPAFVNEFEGFGRLTYDWATGRRSKASFGFGGGQLRNRFFATDVDNFAQSESETTKMNLMQLIAKFDFNTLDNNSFPSTGMRFKASAIQTLGKYHHYYTVVGVAPGISEFAVSPTRGYYNKEQHWFQAEAEGEAYIAAGRKFSFGFMGDVVASNRNLLDSYYATVVNAPSFMPTVSVSDVFNRSFRANSFVAAGVTPIWRPVSNAQVRLSGYGFMPFRSIKPAPDGIGAVYGRWFSDLLFIGELDLVYNLPFASVCGYVNYLSDPQSSWNVGLSFGLYFTAAKFLR